APDLVANLQQSLSEIEVAIADIQGAHGLAFRFRLIVGLSDKPTIVARADGSAGDADRSAFAGVPAERGCVAGAGAGVAGGHRPGLPWGLRRRPPEAPQGRQAERPRAHPGAAGHRKPVPGAVATGGAWAVRRRHRL